MLAYDLYEANGARSPAALTEEYNRDYDGAAAARPDQVGMTGIYITMVQETHVVIGLPQVNAVIEADFGKFEIKTFRIDQAGEARQVDFLEGIA